MMSQRNPPVRGEAPAPSAPFESGSPDGLEKFMSVMLTYLGFNVTKLPAMAATAANLTTVRLSSGISANILDFGIPQKHVLSGMTAMDTGGKPLKGQPCRCR